MAYIAKHTIGIGGKYFAPGEQLPTLSEAELAALEGHVQPADEPLPEVKVSKTVVPEAKAAPATAPAAAAAKAKGGKKPAAPANPSVVE